MMHDPAWDEKPKTQPSVSAPGSSQSRKFWRKYQSIRSSHPLTHQ